MKNKKRCEWCGTDPEYIKYHDEDWGVPVRKDRKHFEFLTLEGAQAGLSWITILKRRKGYKKAFYNFDPKKVAKMTKRDVARLMKDTGIIRNRLKIESTISNAQAFLEIQKEFGSFDTYIWNLVGGKPIINRFKSVKELPAKTPLAETLSKDLKQRGFRFVGPTIMYAHMQATGLVNDHITSCFRFSQLSSSPEKS